MSKKSIKRKIMKISTVSVIALTLSSGLIYSMPATSAKACNVPCLVGWQSYPGYILSKSSNWDGFVQVGVQTNLNNLAKYSGDSLYSCGTADGYFGSRTKSAVIHYQQKHGLVADGIVGPATWNSIQSHPLAPYK